MDSKIYQEKADKVFRSQREQDAMDFGSELSGLQTGRIWRFLSPIAQERLLNKEKPDKDGKLSLLDIHLLTNRQYAVAYANLSDCVTQIKDRITIALDAIAVKEARLNARLENMRDQAYVLSDGRRAYRDVDDSIYTEDGEVLTDKDIAVLVDDIEDVPLLWPDYKNIEKDKLILKKDRADIEKYRDHDVAQAERTLATQEDMPDIDALAARTHALEKNIPSALGTYAPVDDSNANTLSATQAARPSDGESGLNAPDINHAFGHASAEAVMADPAFAPEMQPKNV